MYRKKRIWQYLLPVVISIAITHNVEVQAQWPQAFPYPSDFPVHPGFVWV